MTYMLRDPNDGPAYDALVRKIGAQGALDKWAAEGWFRVMTAAEHTAYSRATTPKAAPAAAPEPDTSKWDPALRQAWNSHKADSGAEVTATGQPALAVAAPAIPQPSADDLRWAEYTLATVDTLAHSFTNVQAAKKIVAAAKAHGAAPDTSVRSAEIALAIDHNKRMNGEAGMDATERSRLQATVDAGAAKDAAAAAKVAPAQSREARVAGLSGMAAGISCGGPQSISRVN